MGHIRLPVHPHVCGEHARHDAMVAAPARFTPTCVGNTISSAVGIPEQYGSPPRVWGTRSRSRSPYRARTVHPHVCGEHTRPFRRLWWPLRFTPTCVGNTQVERICKEAVSVHPHVCGEHTGLFKSASPCVGSPPRVWGTLVLDVPEVALFRFTPTCVGNTWSLCPERIGRSVHPHVCGEH